MTLFHRLRNRIRQLCAIRYILPLRDEYYYFERNVYYELGAKNSQIPQVMTLEETLSKVVEGGLSLCRLGDGEFDLLQGGDMLFEKFNPDMRKSLLEIFEEPFDKCLVCIPPVFGSLEALVREERRDWRKIVSRWREPITRLLGASCVYGNAFITRPYLRYEDATVGPCIFGMWKKIFSNRDLLIVEGRYSRLGYGNDLFDGARSIRRIWCPQTGAFAQYDKIMNAVRMNAKDGDLILLALGGTATIMAYQLSRMGFQALDVGHLDVEYVWMLSGANKKEPIAGRYVSECGTRLADLKPFDMEEEQYHVIAKVGV